MMSLPRKGYDKGLLVNRSRAMLSEVVTRTRCRMFCAVHAKDSGRYSSVLRVLVV
jgi:hypothetical protein